MGEKKMYFYGMGNSYEPELQDFCGTSRMEKRLASLARIMGFAGIGIILLGIFLLAIGIKNKNVVSIVLGIVVLLVGIGLVVCGIFNPFD